MDDGESPPSLDRAQSPRVAVPTTAISGLTSEKLLQEVFGYPRFRGEQANIIQHICDGGDALVLMPTGGGKSLCYQIPALVREGAGIICSPLIALMQDQVAALKQLGVRAAFLNS
ncbi:MAG: DEAD/DEAH box helicase, partial [Betaproteobacteria bacterium]|nr:DEAD/DEAH box helicase [Betaproteobacteria bacterium]